MKLATEHEITDLIKELRLDEAELNPDLPAPGNSKGGIVQVKDQVIIVKDPKEGGPLPTICALPPVKLFVNGTPVAGEIAVCEADRITWEIEQEPLFEITVSEDRMTAYFKLRATERYAWQLVDTEPGSRIFIRAEEDRSCIIEKVDLACVAAALDKLSIRMNIDLVSIQKEILQPTYEPVVIARGKEAVQGEDAKLELYFSEKAESQFFEVSGTVDFRNHLKIPSVNAGDLIARKYPVSDGIPGYDVYGNVVLPAPPKDIFITAKDGVELLPDGRVVAQKSGRPRITGDRIKTFDISTSYIVPGNVDLETGNIVFSGDVIIYGNITDNMIVESLGNVYVYGSVYNATVTATGSIRVRGNVTGSKLYSGYFGVLFNRLYHTSKMLNERIGMLIAAAQMLEHAIMSRNQTTRFGQIVHLLLENKFTEVPNLVKELILVISNIQSIEKNKYKQLMNIAEVFLQPNKLLGMANFGFLQQFQALLAETHHEVARMQETKVDISINQCHNSELKSNGDIFIKREGVLLSQLYSAGNILFEQESAVCRGSKLEAGGSIIARIVGGQTATKTLLKAKTQVSVGKMLSGRICVNRYCIDIYEPIENKVFDAATMQYRKNVWSY